VVWAWEIVWNGGKNGKMTPAGLGVDGKGCVAPGVEDGAVGSMEGGAEVRGTFKVGEDADELDEVALRRVGVVGGCHDDCELDLGKGVRWVGRESVQQVARILRTAWSMDAMRAPVTGSK